jgi:hypothetical protein
MASSQHTNFEPSDEALQRLDAQLPLFPFHRDEHRLYIARPNQAVLLLDLEQQEMAALDNICRKWAASTGLSQLNEANLHLLYARFQQAHVFAHWIYGKVAFPQKTTAEILVFFLVDHWHFYGRAVWISQMIAFSK